MSLASNRVPLLLMLALCFAQLCVVAALGAGRLLLGMFAPAAGNGASNASRVAAYLLVVCLSAGAAWWSIRRAILTLDVPPTGHRER